MARMHIVGWVGPLAILLVASACASEAVASSDAPLAPKVEPSPQATDIDKAVVQGAVVPSRSAVGVPAYPDSRVFRTSPGGSAGDGEDEVRLLPSVSLLSDAEPETVAAWYLERLDGWQREEALGTIFLVPEGVELDVVFLGSHRVIHIVPIEAGEPGRRLSPSARSEITIAYEG